MIVFDLINLSYNKKELFKDFSLRIKQGEKILLSAPSGSGKTTLLKLLLGFHKPDSGNIFFDSKKLNKQTLKYFRENISYVSQDVDLPPIIVSELLNTIFTYKTNKHIVNFKDAFSEHCEKYSLEKSILTKNIKALSGGERQRLGFIISIMLNRKVLLLDEITSGLDKKLTQTIIETVLNSNKTVLIISHESHWLTNDITKSIRW